MNTESGIPVTGLYADEAPSGYIEPPTNTQFHSGVEPEMTLPAAWWNYFVNLFTNTNIKTKEDITAILAELNNALTTMGITPDPEASNQLATLFQNDVLPVTFANANMNANPYTTSSLVPKHRGNIAINTTTRTTWIATNTTAAAASWSRLWSPENDGSGSGLDADKVRSTTPGTRGLQYLAAAAVANIAPLILEDLKTVDGSGSGLDADTVRGTTPGTRGLQYLAAAAVSNIAALILSDLKTVDGPGSGLDADLWDGIHRPRSFGVSGDYGQSVVTSGDVLTTLTKIGDNGIFGHAVANTPFNAYCSISLILGGDSLNRSTFIATIAGGSSNVWIGAKRDTTITWTKVWTEGNDGPGSGLDADLLDGQHGSYYAAASAIGNLDFVNGVAGIQGYFTVSRGSTLVIPKGLYMMAGEPDTHLQVNYSGSWFGSAPSGGLVLSDGVNYRLQNVNTTNNTRVDYRKLA